MIYEQLPENYQIVQDLDYVIKDGDLYSYVGTNKWNNCQSTIGKKLSQISLVIATKKDNLKKINESNSVIESSEPPAGHHLLEEKFFKIFVINDTNAKEIKIYCNKKWLIPTKSLFGLRAHALIRNNCCSKIALKSSKPYPYGF